MDLNFAEQLVIAAVGGLIAAGGGAFAVFKQLTAAENRRIQRDKVLNECFTEQSLRALSALRFLESQDRVLGLSGIVHSRGGPLKNDLIHGAKAAELVLRRASWWDAFVIRRTWNRVEQQSRLSEVHRACKHSRRHLERRLRGTNGAVRFAASIVERKTPGIAHFELAEAIEVVSAEQR